MIGRERFNIAKRDLKSLSQFTVRLAVSYITVPAKTVVKKDQPFPGFAHLKLKGGNWFQGKPNKVVCFEGLRPTQQHSQCCKKPVR